MFDLSPLTTDHLIIFLIVFLLLFVVLRSVAFYLRPLSQRVPQERVTHDKNPVYYAGPYIVVTIAASAAFFLVKDMPLLMGLVLGAILVLLIGTADEKHNMPPLRQFIWQVVIAATLVYFGWTIPHISHLGGESVINLDWWSMGNWIFPGSLLAIIWLVFVMNAFNWLDGADGLVGSVAVAVFMTLALISLLPATQDNRTLSLAIVGAAAVSAFLIWNFAPARVYLGTTGSWFLGLYIGLVAMIGGGKLATALLVLAIPVLDALLVIGQRLFDGRRPWQGDKTRHLHFRLMDYGWSPRIISIGAGLVTAVLGVGAVFLQTSQKIWLLGIIGLALLVLSGILYRKAAY